MLICWCVIHVCAMLAWKTCACCVGVESMRVLYCSVIPVRDVLICNYISSNGINGIRTITPLSFCLQGLVEQLLQRP